MFQSIRLKLEPCFSPLWLLSILSDAITSQLMAAAYGDNWINSWQNEKWQIYHYKIYKQCHTQVWALWMIRMFRSWPTSGWLHQFYIFALSAAQHTWDKSVPGGAQDEQPLNPLLCNEAGWSLCCVFSHIQLSPALFHTIPGIPTQASPTECHMSMYKHLKDVFILRSMPEISKFLFKPVF